jgi:hypothetical protein
LVRFVLALLRRLDRTLPKDSYVSVGCLRQVCARE